MEESDSPSVVRKPTGMPPDGTVKGSTATGTICAWSSVSPSPKSIITPRSDNSANVTLFSATRSAGISSARIEHSGRSETGIITVSITCSMNVSP